jgi:hypothetical protein
MSTTTTIDLACAVCGRGNSAPGDRRPWGHKPYGGFLCPDHTPPQPLDTPEIKTLMAERRMLRLELREYDDPTERAITKEKIEDLTDEIETLRDDLRWAVQS